MLTFILIAGLVWLAVALVFVLALAGAARKQISPVGVSTSAEPIEQMKSNLTKSQKESAPSLPASVEEPVAT